MTSRMARPNKDELRRIRAEAVVWIAELHDPHRERDLDARVNQWLAEDPRHKAAFDRATALWQSTEGAESTLRSRTFAWMSRVPRARFWAPVLAGGAVFCGILVAAAYYLSDAKLVTGPGEQRTVELSDGTQVSLNANSRVLLQYDDRVRKVTLARGEALFDVAKQSARPFVVVIGERKVVAIGTSFLVRREESGAPAYAVTLVEGRVAVEPLSGPDVLPTAESVGLKLLRPGERLRFVGDAPGAVDAPSIAKVTAWQHGQLIFEDTSLAEAAAEFNRYGAVKLVIDSPRIARLRVGGVFRIGDPSSFAQAMASAYQLRVVDQGRRILITEKNSR
jgi:transmembrane sensor